MCKNKTKNKEKKLASASSTSKNITRDCYSSSHSESSPSRRSRPSTHPSSLSLPGILPTPVAFKKANMAAVAFSAWKSCEMDFHLGFLQPTSFLTSLQRSRISDAHRGHSLKMCSRVTLDCEVRRRRDRYTISRPLPNQDFFQKLLTPLPYSVIFATFNPPTIQFQ
jgi:hypothetical protein